jgi:hypothetical protein
MPSRGSRRLLAVLLGPVVLLGAASCADDDPSSAGGGDPTAVVATERALAAAVERHLGREAVAAAPLFSGDGLPPGAVGVELAFDRPVGDHTHVRVVVSPPGADPDAKQLRTCRGTPTTWECEQDVVGATSYVLLREAGYPEEDPGLVGAVGRRDGVVVLATAHGPFVPPAGGEGETDDVAQAEELADLLRAVVTDPAVGLRTSEHYEEVGASIEDDRWLDWYGQGNGASEPEGYRPT